MEEHCKINIDRQRVRRTVERQTIQQQPTHNAKPRISTRHLELMSEEMNNAAAKHISIDTPCRRIASLKLEVKVTPKPVKQSKLLSSKSLSQLVPRKLFFVRTKQQQNADSSEEKVSNKSKDNKPTGKLQTSKSLTNAAFQFDPSIDLTLRNEIINGSSAVNSVSLIGFPRHSTSNSFAQSSSSSNGCCSLARPNISPIVGDNMVPAVQGPKGSIATSTPQGTKTKAKQTLRKRGLANKVKDKKNVIDDTKTTTVTNSSRYRPFRNTALVLRDVKNSIGLVSTS